MLSSRASTATALFAAALWAPTRAAAHHMMDDAVPTAIWEGFVSGLAHPVIGLDHLAFLVAGGVLAAGSPRKGGVMSMGAFLGLGLVGALLHLAGWNLGVAEVVVALSVLFAGIALLTPPDRRATAAPAVLAVTFAVAGLFHGHAYAEAIAGARPAVVLAYLLALTAMQAMLAGAVTAMARHFDVQAGSARRQRRAVGLAAAVVGAVALTSAVLA